MRDYESKLVDSSRIIADLIVEDIGCDPDRFTEMMHLAFRDEYPLSMRAARVVSLVVENYPEVINGQLDTIIEMLPKLKIEGVRRGFLKVFAENMPELNEEQIGLLTDLAFTWLDDPKQAMAIRYYSIEILVCVCSKYPELKNELSAILEGLSREGSPGLKSRSLQVLNSFRKK
ncbi:MAG: hypothetical protein JW801_03345 [Bacteroidales bacterium]|nr:hypothetical protein [Bacteroidales bacterium]